MTAPAAAPSRYATGDQRLAVASDLTALASWLMQEGDGAPIRATDHVFSCHLDDLGTLKAKAAGLGLPLVLKGGQWRAEKRFGATVTYVIWTEDLGEQS